MSVANPAVILAKGDVETPVEAIFYTPMVWCSHCKPVGVTRQAGNEVSRLLGGLVADFSGRLNHANVVSFSIWIFLQTSPHLIIILFRILEEELHLFMEIPLIALKGKNIVGALIDYLPGNFLLAPHGVSGHHTTIDVENLEQFRDGCNLIGFILRFYLTQDQPMANRPGTDH